MARLRTIDDGPVCIAYWDEHRKELPLWQPDGPVFKINFLRQQLNLGYTAKSPRAGQWLPSSTPRACTLLKRADLETGRMGHRDPCGGES